MKSLPPARGFSNRSRSKSRGATVHFESVAVHHGKDEVNELTFHSIIKTGEPSRVFDLPGEALMIRKVVFDHKKIRGASGKAEVVLWGRK